MKAPMTREKYRARLANVYQLSRCVSLFSMPCSRYAIFP
jgi:hypothetical protein